MGFAAMALFTAIALFTSYLTVNAINRDTRDLAERDLPVLGALIKLRSSIIAQEGYAAKYAILKDPAFIGLFRQRETESLANLALLEKKDRGSDVALLKARYAEYEAAVNLLFLKSGGEGTLRASAGNLLNEIDNLYEKRQGRLQEVLRLSSYRQSSAMRWTIIISAAGFLLAIGVAAIVTYRTFHSIRALQAATHRIAAGKFDFVPQVEGRDEISELAEDFKQMAARLKVLEQMNLDASPLTRLPGNAAIERVLDERLKSGEEFAFCYADLDNFKPFSDHYGYAKGSDLLRVTGDLIEATVKEICGDEGFTGHVGGDDYVMVVPTDKAVAICEQVISRFDEEVIKHFSAEDRSAGGIEGTDRYGVQRFFPITTISIAVIFCGRQRYSSAVDIARAAAKVKDRAKGRPGSSYLMNGHELTT